jgi:predicted nucleotidyltransferase
MSIITNLELQIASEITKDLTKARSINKLKSTLNKQYRPVYLAVQKMLKKDILKKDSNGLIVPLFEETFIFEYAERKRASEIRSKELKIIAKKLENIKDSFFSAVLFGSSVNQKGSDIDLLLIISDLGDTEEFGIKARKAFSSFLPKIDLNIINEKSCYEMLNRPNQLNVMNEILKNHLVLFGFENFYRIIKRWKYDK